MVAGEHDQGVAGKARGVESVQQPADVAVDLRDHGEVADLGPHQRLVAGAAAPPLGRERRRLEVAPGVKLQQVGRGDQRAVRVVEACDAQVRVGVARPRVEVGQRPVGHEGRVRRRRVAGVRPGGIGVGVGRGAVQGVVLAHRLGPDLPHRRVGDLPDVGQLAREVPGDPRQVGVVVDARLVADLGVLEAVGRVRPAVVAVGVGQEVQLAEVGRAVAEAAQHPRQRFGFLGYGHAHVRDAQARRVSAGQEAQPRWHAQRVLHEALVEPHAAGRQAVDVGRQDLGVAGAADGVVPQLVGVDQQNARVARLIHATELIAPAPADPHPPRRPRRRPITLVRPHMPAVAETAANPPRHRPIKAVV